ncbi:hypothetical protein RHDC4_02608 [Rhodocyclaceae bacterium]|nr:hypothetical protein RHDC4_02608 [Rhodocyclaceae bacterium]
MATTKAGGGKAPVKFHVASGDKGGVGKSFLALSLIDYLDGRGEEVVVLEADKFNPDVARMYKNSLPCYSVDLTNENGWMEVMDAVIKHPNATFVMSCPAGIGGFLETHLPSFKSFLTKHNKTPMELALWWVMNPQHDSVNLLAEAMRRYGNEFATVRVVCNTHFSDNKPDAFFLWDESPLRAQLEKDGGMTLYLEGLNLRVVTKLFDPRKIIPFSDASDAALGEQVGLTESERFKLTNWRERQALQFGHAFAQPRTQAAPAPAAAEA